MSWRVGWTHRWLDGPLESRKEVFFLFSVICFNTFLIISLFCLYSRDFFSCRFGADPFVHTRRNYTFCCKAVFFFTSSTLTSPLFLLFRSLSDPLLSSFLQLSRIILPHTHTGSAVTSPCFSTLIEGLGLAVSLLQTGSELLLKCNSSNRCVSGFFDGEKWKKG